MNTRFTIPTAHRRCAEFLEEVIGFTHTTIYYEDARLLLGDTAQHLREHRFVLALVGHWNSGKSTLINRLLFGEEAALLPVEDKPTTARITYLQYGSEPRLQRFWTGRRTTELLADGDDAVRSVLGDLAASTLAAGDEDFELIVDWPAEVLKDGLVIVDTPGLQDPNRVRSITTEHSMARFHSVIVVTTASAPLTESLWAFIEQNVFRRQMGKFFFLVNKIDRLPVGRTTPEAVVTFVHSQIERKVDEMNRRFATEIGRDRGPAGVPSKDRFFGVSARMGDGLGNFTEALSSFLAVDKNLEQLRGAVVCAAQFFARCRERIAAEELAAGQKRQDFQADIGRLDRLRKRLESELNHLHDVLKGEFDDIARRITVAIRERFAREGMAGRKFLEENRGRWKPASLARDLRFFAEKSARLLEVDMEAVEQQLKRDIESAVRKHEAGIVAAIQELDELAFELRNRMAGDGATVGAMGGFNAGDTAAVSLSGVAAAAAGGGIAVASGAATATWTTSTVVSTAPHWVPLGVAKFFGWTTTVTAMNSALVVGTIVIWIAVPALATAAATAGFVSWHKRNATIKNFEKHLAEIEVRAAEICSDVEKRINESFTSVIDSLQTQTDKRLKSHRDEIRAYEQAVAACSVSDACRELKAQIPLWETKLAELT
jgi:GTPase SAR1 family protein